MDPRRVFTYDGTLYPTYIRDGNACRFILPMAQHFCLGVGLDVGGWNWPLPGAIVVDRKNGGDAMNLPEGEWDFIFSSHCLEHLENPIAALEHWKKHIIPGGVLFLYLPHPDMLYWRTTRNRKHLHQWVPDEMEWILTELGFQGVMTSGRDLAWSFAAVGWKP
jgi:SAM-dependent methyltransferase